MATPDELRAAIATGRAELKAAIADAADNWDRKPSGAEGEEAWSARQVAEHVIAAEVGFTTMVCEPCGYPGLERIQPSYTAAAEASDGFDEVTALCDSKLKYVTETDLTMKHEHFGTVENLLQIYAGHLQDHAAQIRTAGGVSQS